MIDLILLEHYCKIGNVCLFVYVIFVFLSVKNIMRAYIIVFLATSAETTNQKERYMCVLFL